jgi:hypothetical protein
MRKRERRAKKPPKRAGAPPAGVISGKLKIPIGFDEAMEIAVRVKPPRTTRNRKRQ